MIVLGKKPVAFAEAKKILGKKKVSELGYEQKITLDYLRKIVKIKEKDVEKAIEELSQIEGLKEHQIINLVNLLPETEDDVEVIFAKERTTLNKDQIKKILEILNEIRPKKKKK